MFASSLAFGAKAAKLQHVEMILCALVSYFCWWSVLLIIYCAFCLQTALESQVLDGKDKAQRLQTELDVSEQVQKDFVKLSQTLQVTKA